MESLKIKTEKITQKYKAQVEFLQNALQEKIKVSAELTIALVGSKILSYQAERDIQASRPERADHAYRVSGRQRLREAGLSRGEAQVPQRLTQ